MSLQDTCLIIDDSDVVRKVMRTVLEGMSFVVEDTPTLSEALASCFKLLPHLIVVDWHIPGGDPLEFIATIRKRPSGRDTKILYVLTDNDPAAIARAMNAGADTTMIKPFHGVTLEAKVARLISPDRALDDDSYVQRHLRKRGR